MSSVELVLYDLNGNGIFYPGQTVTGRVECNFNTDKNVNAVQLKFKGKGHTEWDKTESEYDNQREEYVDKTVTYTAGEVYLDRTYTLHQAGGNSTNIRAGKHTYPFSCTLPTRLPPSFEGSYGNIRYSVKAIVDRPWKTNFTHKRVLKMGSRLNLNTLSELREPVAISLDETMSTCCCNSGQLTFNMSLPATGFVPGQDISIGLHVLNMANVNVEYLKFKIVKKLYFITRRPSKSVKREKYVLTSCTQSGIGAHGEKSWTATLTIPENREYPDMRPCGIFDVTYQFEATVVVPFPNSDLKYKTPITIGGIPLTGINTTFAAAPPPTEENEEDTTPSCPPQEDAVVKILSCPSQESDVHKTPSCPPQEDVVVKIPSCPPQESEVHKTASCPPQAVVNIPSCPPQESDVHKTPSCPSQKSEVDTASSCPPSSLSHDNNHLTEEATAL